jgi:hypothetical protein
MVNEIMLIYKSFFRRELSYTLLRNKEVFPYIKNQNLPGFDKQSRKAIRSQTTAVRSLALFYPHQLMHERIAGGNIAAQLVDR